MDEESAEFGAGGSRTKKNNGRNKKGKERKAGAEGKSSCSRSCPGKGHPQVSLPAGHSPDPVDLNLILVKLHQVISKALTIEDKGESLISVADIMKNCVGAPSALPSLHTSDIITNVILLLKKLLATNRGESIPHEFFPLGIQSTHPEESRIIVNKAAEYLFVVSKSLAEGEDALSFLELLVGDKGGFTLNKLLLDVKFSKEDKYDNRTNADLTSELSTHSQFPTLVLIKALSHAVNLSKELLLNSQRIKKFCEVGEGYNSNSTASLIFDLVPIAMIFLELTGAVVSIGDLYYPPSVEPEKPQIINLQEEAWSLLLTLVQCIPFPRFSSQLLSEMCQFANRIYTLERDSDRVSDNTLLLIRHLVSHTNFELKYIPEIGVIREIYVEQYNFQHVAKYNVSTPVVIPPPSISDETLPVLDIVHNIKAFVFKMEKALRSKDLPFLEKNKEKLYEVFQLLCHIQIKFPQEFASSRRVLSRIPAGILHYAVPIENELLTEGRSASQVEAFFKKSIFWAAVEFHLSCVHNTRYYSEETQDIWDEALPIIGIVYQLQSSELLCRSLEIFDYLCQDVFMEFEGWKRDGIIKDVKAMADTDEIQLANGKNKCMISIRVKAARCLALFCQMNFILSEKKELWEFAALICRGMKSRNLAVRSSFAWALGKWTDALIENYGDSLPFRDFDMIEVFQTISKACRDSVKIRYNGFRAAGNVLRYISAADLMLGLLQPVNDIINSIVDQVGSGLDYKARWNAVHALGRFLDNPDVSTIDRDAVSHFGSSFLKDLIIPKLTKWVVSSQNYKERIQCAWAIGKLNSGWARRLPVTIPYLWIQLLNSILKPPYEELELASKLEAEVVTSLAKLTGSLEPGDIPQLQDTIISHSEMIIELFQTTQMHLGAERLEDLQRARDRIKALRSHGDQQVIQVLMDAFKIEDDLSDLSDSLISNS